MADHHLCHKSGTTYTPLRRILPVLSVAAGVCALAHEILASTHLPKFLYFLLYRRLIKVLSATALRPTGLQGLSDPYCVCYLKIPDSTDFSKDDLFCGQRGETYFVEKTLNPKWSGQRFIFKVACLKRRSDPFGGTMQRATRPGSELSYFSPSPESPDHACFA